jgi:hypothetical protein
MVMSAKHDLLLQFIMPKTIQRFSLIVCLLQLPFQLFYLYLMSSLLLLDLLLQAVDAAF